MRLPHVTIWLAITLFLLTASILDSDAAELAGWSEVDITPPIGIALGGRGGNYTMANEILDPLYAQVLLVKDSKGTEFVLVSLDLIGLPRELSDRIRLSILREIGVPWNLVLLNCSHTHSGPNMLRSLLAGVDSAPQNEDDYFNSLHQKILLASRQAAKSLKPVKVEVFTGSSAIAINRRGTNNSGGISMIPNPHGKTDPNLWVMRLKPEDGTESAIVFSHACHPVIVYGSKPAAISADFPGQTRHALRAIFGQSTHAQFVQGFAGNVRPRVLADLAKHRFRPGTPEDAQQVGATLAKGVTEAIKGGGQSLKLDFAAAADQPSLRRGAPPPRAVFEKLAKDPSDYPRAAAGYWLKRYDRGEGFSKADPWPIGLIRLASRQWIVWSCGEPVVEWRQKIRDWLGNEAIVPLGYCQEANTYLPTEELLPQGGYEVLDCNRNRATSPAPFAPGIEEELRKSLVRQLAFIEAMR